jgi:enoyl-CoA hydratase/carnithine racemase
LPPELEPAPLAGGAVLLQIHSPDGLNRLSIALLRALALAPEAFPQARGFVLAGNERCFSAGADLAAIASLDAASAWRLAREGQHWLGRIALSSAPFVAAVDGHCLGGGFDLALACRLRICTPRAHFGHHGAKLGLVTGWGGTQRLPRLIGAPRALRHLLAADGWNAEQAMAQGLVTAVVAPAELTSAAGNLIYGILDR